MDLSMPPFVPPRQSSRHATALIERHEPNFDDSDCAALIKVRRRQDAISQEPMPTEISSGIERRMRQTSSQLDLYESAGRAMRKAYNKGSLDAKAFNEWSTAVKKDQMEISEELARLKDDKKTHENIEESASSNVLDALTGALLSTTWSTGSRANRTTFADDVAAFYECRRGVKGDENNPLETYCHLTRRWYDSGVTNAHIVPRSLENHGLEALFVIGKVLLESGDNGLSLLSSVERAWDELKIVFVPTRLENPTEWRCVVIDENLLIRDRSILGGLIRWADLNGKELKFLNNNRPRRRYMYFRYVMAYLELKRRNKSLDWLKDHPMRKTRFFTPTAYMNRSILATLAKRIGDTEDIQGFEEVVKDGVFEGEKVSDEAMQDIATDLETAIIARGENKENEDSSDEEDDE